MVGLAAICAPLFVPANRPDRFAKAEQSGTDAVILDLEDSVAVEAKDAARAALCTDFTGLPVIVRINAPDTRWHDADLVAVRQVAPSAVMLPKTESAEVIAAVARGLDGIPLLALIETARGLAAARQIAAVPGVVRLVFGSIDFCADLQCEHRRDVLLPARSEVVLASRLAGIAGPFDGVTVQLEDLSISHDDALHACSMGMTGKLCIHPRQVGEVLRAFIPNEQEIRWAERVVTSGDGAVMIDGAMVDEPVRVRAKGILEKSKRVWGNHIYGRQGPGQGRER